MKKMFLLLPVILLSLTAMAQKIENVDFKVKDSKVIITYDLTNCPDRTTYDISVKLKSESGEVFYPKNPYGDLKEVSPGSGKTVTWDVLGDELEIKGNISAVVEIEKSHYTKTKKEKLVYGKVKGGPSNAFLSMLLPGLGDVFVNRYTVPKKKNVWWLVPLAYYGCLYGAVSEYSNYNTNYTAYHNATLQSDMDNYYSNAKTNYQNSQLYLGFAAAFWACDVLHVTVKGFKNRHRQLKGYSIIEPKTNLYLLPVNKGLQLGLVCKF